MIAMPTLRLTIDGREVSVYDTVRLYQAAPFPGGHQYELVISDAHGWPWDQLAPGEAPRPSEQQELFLALERAIAAEPSEGSPPATFALNTVAAVELREGEVLLSGVCSPIVLEEVDGG